MILHPFPMKNHSGNLANHYNQFSDCLVGVELSAVGLDILVLIKTLSCRRSILSNFSIFPVK